MNKLLSILLISFVTMLVLNHVDGQGFAWFVTGFSSLSTMMILLQISTEIKPFIEHHAASTMKTETVPTDGQMSVKKGGLYAA